MQWSRNTKRTVIALAVTALLCTTPFMIDALVERYLPKADHAVSEWEAHMDEGWRLLQEEQFEQAAQEFQMAWSITTGAQWNDEDASVGALSMLGRAHLLAGNFAKARSAFEEWLRVEENAFAPSPAHLARAQIALAEAYDGEGDHEAALAYGVGALAAWEKSDQSDKAQSLHILDILAQVYERTGQIEHAARIWRRINQLNTRLLIDEYGTVAKARRTLVSLEYRIGNYEEAKRLCAESIRLLQETPSEDDALVMDFHLVYAALLEREGRHQEALDTYDRVKDRLANTACPEVLQTSRDLLTRIALDLGGAGRLDDASDWERRIIELSASRRKTP
ncbi:MAG: tetratricopeptide repeat protein [Phycisphaerales bacterium]|nr:MAG: tetratricopeptide repeat protein [Phycisphaerales bacterium]